MDSTQFAGIPPADKITVRELIDVYLLLGVDDIVPAALQAKKEVLRRFAVMFGQKRIEDCKALDMTLFMHCQERVAAESTKRSWISIVKRVFNWGLDFEIVARNPFARVRSRGRLNSRAPMNDADYQTLLRHSPPHWRRLLVFLRFSGCRPGEAASMRWADVRFEQNTVILAKHKTAKKTGKPRIIPLVPTTAKLLAWIRTHRQVSVIGLVERFLADGPARCTDLAKLLHRYGVSYMASQRARRALGVEAHRVGGAAAKGHRVYSLPEGPSRPCPDGPPARAGHRGFSVENILEKFVT